MKAAAVCPAVRQIPVSIALCTYQGGSYLGAQLDSLLTQTRLPDEIVVFDDASQDGTWEQLQSFSRQASALNVHVALHQNPANVGYIENFQLALESTKGALVFLCDQDDIWHADRLARYVAEFERRPDLLMLHSDARLVDGTGKSLGCGLFEAFEIGKDELDAVHRGKAFEVLLRRNIVTGATMAVRRSVIDRQIGVPDGWIHDEWLAMVAATLGPVDCLEEATIDYRQHGSNQVGARRRGFLERLTVTSGKVSHIEFMARMLLRTQTLSDIVESGRLHLDPQSTHLLSERLRHAKLRSALPLALLPRSSAVFAEYASGRYKRFSNGMRSLLSDLVRRHR